MKNSRRIGALVAMATAAVGMGSVTAAAPAFAAPAKGPQPVSSWLGAVKANTDSWVKLYWRTDRPICEVEVRVSGRDLDVEYPGRQRFSSFSRSDKLRPGRTDFTAVQVNADMERSGVAQLRATISYDTCGRRDRTQFKSFSLALPVMRNNSHQGPSRPGDGRPGDNHGRPGDNNNHGRPGDDNHGRPGDDNHGRPGDDNHGRPGDSNNSGRPGDGDNNTRPTANPTSTGRPTAVPPATDRPAVVPTATDRPATGPTGTGRPTPTSGTRDNDHSSDGPGKGDHSGRPARPTSSASTSTPAALPAAK